MFMEPWAEVKKALGQCDDTNSSSPGFLANGPLSRVSFQLHLVNDKGDNEKSRLWIDLLPFTYGWGKLWLTSARRTSEDCLYHEWGLLPSSEVGRISLHAWRKKEGRKERMRKGQSYLFLLRNYEAEITCKYCIRIYK